MAIIPNKNQKKLINSLLNKDKDIEAIDQEIKVWQINKSIINKILKSDVKPENTNIYTTPKFTIIEINHKEKRIKEKYRIRIGRDIRPLCIYSKKMSKECCPCNVCPGYIENGEICIFLSPTLFLLVKDLQKTFDIMIDWLKITKLAIKERNKHE